MGYAVSLTGGVADEASRHRLYRPHPGRGGRRGAYLHRDRVNGVLRARRGVRLSSETEGRVLEVGAEALDAVEEDHVLVQVDPLRARASSAAGRPGSKWHIHHYTRLGGRNLSTAHGLLYFGG